MLYKSITYTPAILIKTKPMQTKYDIAWWLQIF